jgi:hypothetical protein
MRESCFCGRSGELQDREPVLELEGGGSFGALPAATSTTWSG